MRLVEIAYFVKDLEQVMAFYERFLGTRPARLEPGHAGEFVLDGVRLFIHQYAPAPDFELPDVDHVAFGVENVDAACAELAGRGVSVERGPKTWPWGRSAMLQDPDGNWIELYETKVG